MILKIKKKVKNYCTNYEFYQQMYNFMNYGNLVIIMIIMHILHLIRPSHTHTHTHTHTYILFIYLHSVLLQFTGLIMTILMTLFTNIKL